MEYEWQSVSAIGRKSFTCGYCGHKVGQDRGYYGKEPSGNTGYIYPCPNCTMPTVFDHWAKQTPSVRLGRDVAGISDKGVDELYKEARDCSSVGAYTGAILLCRKILMNVAAQHGADAGKSFVFYVDYLQNQGFVPPNGQIWVDEIRKKGNEATHEIPQSSLDDAQRILSFVEMLLRFVYEFPSMVKGPNKEP